jgi:uncharacterized membrane-anchored protein
VCWGDPSSLVPAPPSTQEPDWITGPAKADLADSASIEVPESYRFTGPQGARLLLQRMRNPVPVNLAGIVAPSSGKWWVVLAFADVGYMKGVNQASHIDSAAILQAVREQVPPQNAMRMRQGVPPITSVDWAIEPVLDTNRCSLEWALRAETRTEKVVNLRSETTSQLVINHTIRLIGRRLVLDATAVQPDQGDHVILPLKELVDHISFKQGERYSDFQNGDKIAKIRLEQLIIGEERKKEPSAYTVAGIWIGSILLAGGLVTVGVLLIRHQIRRQKMSRAFPDYEEHGHPLTHLISASGNGSNNHNGSRRKRMFNYQKFYSDMMLEVSAGARLGGAAANGKHVSRVPNGRISPPPAERNGNDSLARANSELIANQINLIEEQKRLLQEQAKLIEEKRKLIEQKNQILEKQAELLETDLR